MKKQKILSLLLLLSLLLSLLQPVYAVESEPEEETEETQEQEESREEEDPAANIFKTPVKAAMLIELNTGRILFAQDPDEKNYPASLTKIMTTLVALENGNLDDLVTVSATAIEGFDSPAYQVGEQLRLEDLLYMVMVKSSNESCNVVAEHIAGSKEAYVELMNEKARELGCTGTHFANTHGLHHEDHYTTARDLSKIVIEALKNETFRILCNTATYTVPATNMSEERVIDTTNMLINNKAANNQFYYSKAKGVKTGFTTPAGRCLISTASNDNLNLLAIILGADTLEDESGNWIYRNFPECINLFQYGFEQFRITTVLSTLYPVAEISVNQGANSQTVALAPEEEVRVLIETNYDPEAVVHDVSLAQTSVDAPVEAGQVLGSITISYEGEVLGTCNLVAITSIARSEITHNAEKTREYLSDNWWKWLVGILLGAAGVIVVIFLLLQLHGRKMRKRKVAARRRALELNRRRQEWNIPGPDDRNERD